MTKKNNVKVKLIAGMMAVVTATSPILTYAAEVPMAEALSIEQEDGITRIETDTKQETKFLFIHLNQGGSVILNKGELDQRRITLEKMDDKVHINVYDKDGILVSSEDAMDNKNTYMYEVDADSVITVDADADKGYEIAAFESKKDNLLEETGFVDKIVEDKEKPQEDFSYPVFMNKDTNISVKFKKLEENKDDKTDENVTDTEPTDEKEDLIEESKSDVGDESEDIILNEQDTAAQNEQVEGEEAEEPFYNSSIDKVIEVPEETDSENLIESNGEALDSLVEEELQAQPEVEVLPKEPFAEVDEAYINDLAELESKDFASARLVIMANSPEDIIDPEHVISSYNDIYLLQYKSVEQAMNAYVYYKNMVQAIEPDMPIKVAITNKITGNTSATEENISLRTSKTESTEGYDITITKETNPLALLAEEKPSVVASSKSNVIALIDTGTSQHSNVVDRVSLIDDVLVGGTHGDQMLKYITEENPNAKVLSVRALDDNGYGSYSSVISAIEYAIKSKVDVINLSMYAKKTLMTSVLEAQIQKAIDSGILVVGSAGNDGANVTDGYVPACIDDAYIIGAVNTKGYLSPISNFGDTVDYYVVSESTSEAAARFSGYISVHGLTNIKENTPEFIFETFKNDIENDISNNMKIVDELQIPLNSNFNPETNMENIKVPENAVVELVYSDVNTEIQGMYSTIYLIKTEHETYYVKRPIKVNNNTIKETQYSIGLVSTVPEGITIDIPTTKFTKDNVVYFSVTPQNGVVVNNIKVYQKFDGIEKLSTTVDGTFKNYTDLTIGKDIVRVGDNIPHYMDTINLTPYEATISNENTQYCSFIMPSKEVIIYIDAEYDSGIKAAADNELDKFIAYCGTLVYHYYHPALNTSTAVKQLGTSYRSVKYNYKDSNGKTQKKETPLYCIEPSKSTPLQYGTSTTMYASNGNVQPLKNSSTLAKGLFYLYGGPAWGKTIELKDGSTINMKSLMDNFIKKYPNKAEANLSGGDYWLLTHYILSICYTTENIWNTVMGTTIWNNTGKAWLIDMKNKLASMPTPKAYLERQKADITDKTFKASEMKRQPNGTYDSPTFYYKTLKENIGTITYPKGVALKYDGKTYPGPTTRNIPGGKKISINIDPNTIDPKDLKNGVYTLTIKTRLPVNFEAWKINAAPGTQDLGFGYYTGDGKLKLSVEVPDPENKWSVQVNAKKVNKALKGLEGAVFRVYDNRECIGDALGALTSGPDGMTNIVQIKDIPGSTKEYTVYLKEVNAPQGYLPITEIFELTFTLDKYNELKNASPDPDNFPGELKTFGPPEGIVNEEGIVTPTPSKPSPTPSPGGGTGSGSAGVHVLKKSTASKDIMDLDGYELEGAEFSLTADRADGSSGTLVTDKNGLSNTIALVDNHKEKYHPPIYNQDGDLIQEGRTEIIPVTTVYTITETKAPKGHKMNFKPYSFSVTMPADKNRVEEAIFVDEPYFCKNKLEIEKLGVKGNKIEGVVFKVEFFDSTGPDTSKLKRTWYLESDDKGMIYMDDRHVSKRLGFQSDEFFKHKDEIVIPIDGYLQFTEVAAPAEYVVNDKTFGMATGENANLSKRVYNDMELCEIKIKKYEDDGTTPISGVEFEIKFLEETIKPTVDKNQYFSRLLKEGESYISSTDANGELVFKGLDHGKYQITEVRTHSGNALLKEPIIVTVPMTMTMDEAMEYGDIDFEQAKEDESYTDKWFFYSCLFEITNHATFIVPMTGGNGVWKIGFIGMGVFAMVVTGLIINESSKKRKTKKKNK